MSSIGAAPSAVFVFDNQALADDVIAADERIERPIEADQKHSKLKGLAAGLQGMLAVPHSGDRRFRHSDDAGQGLVVDAQITGRAEHRLGYKGGVGSRRGSGNRIGLHACDQDCFHRNHIVVFLPQKATLRWTAVGFNPIVSGWS